MTDETTSTDETAVSGTTIREAVREHLGNLGDRTRAAVVEHFAAAEADKRAKALIAGLDKLTALENDRRKIKPQFTGFNLDGSGIGEPVFTQEQAKSFKELGEKIEKLKKAIDKADDKADFSDLYNLSK